MEICAIIQSIFASLAVALLVSESTPAVRNRFLSYGARNQPTDPSLIGKEKAEPTSCVRGDTRTSQGYLDSLAGIQVPRNWFKHFYVVSVCASAFWAAQYFIHGRAIDSVTRSQAYSLQPSMSMRQVLLVWSLMALQGTRRLYECTIFDKPSSSKMWFGHWALGIVFYILMSVATWVEGSHAIRYGEWHLESHGGIVAPSLKTFIGFPLFAFGSGIQFDCHAYLASLQKYSLPKHPMFRVLICPHYFAESLIYLALVIVAAPEGQLVNRTLASALAFVVVNLGITAKKTRTWYALKFGKVGEGTAQDIQHLFQRGNEACGFRVFGDYIVYLWLPLLLFTFPVGRHDAWTCAVVGIRSIFIMQHETLAS